MERKGREYSHSKKTPSETWKPHNAISRAGVSCSWAVLPWGREDGCPSVTRFLWWLFQFSFLFSFALINICSKSIYILSMSTRSLGISRERKKNISIPRSQGTGGQFPLSKDTVTKFEPFFSLHFVVAERKSPHASQDRWGDRNHRKAWKRKMCS